MYKKSINANIAFYKFRYLFGLIGAKQIFLSKNAWDFWVSVLIVASTVYYSLLNNLYNFLSSAMVLSAALLGLIIASYAIIAVISDEKLLSMLVLSGYYQYTLFQFTWSAIWLFLALLFSILISLVGAPLQTLGNLAMNAVLSFLLFCLIYGVFGSFISIYKALRQLSIMNSRKTSSLKAAWINYERSRTQIKK